MARWANAQSRRERPDPGGSAQSCSIPRPAVRQITIAGTLEFADNQDLTLAARAIDVQGALVIGSVALRHADRTIVALAAVSSTHC